MTGPYDTLESFLSDWELIRDQMPLFNDESYMACRACGQLVGRITLLDFEIVCEGFTLQASDDNPICDSCMNRRTLEKMSSLLVRGEDDL